MVRSKSQELRLTSASAENIFFGLPERRKSQDTRASIQFRRCSQHDRKPSMDKRMAQERQDVEFALTGVMPVAYTTGQLTENEYGEADEKLGDGQLKGVGDDPNVVRIEGDKADYDDEAVLYEDLSRAQQIRYNIYIFLSDGSSSQMAQFWALWILTCTLVSVLNIILESVESIRIWGQENGNFFFVIETFVVIFFIIDYFGRLFTCPRLKPFLWDFLNFIDFMAIVPWFIEVVLIMIGETGANNVKGLAALRVVRLIRIVRLVKLGKSSLLFRLFLNAMTKGRDGVMFLIFIMGILTVFYSTLIFYAETAGCDLDENGMWVYVRGDAVGEETYFQNIPVSFWWCIVTLTTVGYGDSFPVTNLGRMVAAITMVSAIVVLAFPVTILGHAFGEAAAEYNIEKRMLMNKKVKSGTTDTDGDDEEAAMPEVGLTNEEAKIRHYMDLQLEAEAIRRDIDELEEALREIQIAQKLTIMQVSKDLASRRDLRTLRGTKTVAYGQTSGITIKPTDSGLSNTSSKGEESRGGNLLKRIVSRKKSGPDARLVHIDSDPEAKQTKDGLCVDEPFAGDNVYVDVYEGSIDGMRERLKRGIPKTATNQKEPHLNVPSPGQQSGQRGRDEHTKNNNKHSNECSNYKRQGGERTDDGKVHGIGCNCGSLKRCATRMYKPGGMGEVTEAIAPLNARENSSASSDAHLDMNATPALMPGKSVSSGKGKEKNTVGNINRHSSLAITSVDSMVPLTSSRQDVMGSGSRRSLDSSSNASDGLESETHV
ncbi:hypothetical protein SARC_01337 [Sphaeroforma arctica JP610]|uniref:Ion transport domain-containing protein n=1 Tax=Sphaeroforma arctica JP610 TaxID=667725 RepID=A0A0L0GBW8_9EUKA|nr:hypothetical protein SARC_01337 [Sphaeroforma arctica JP610]KNC86507.1 hypothetical protein SARC_01337 [Sphaeroforma arctica JP610]|eukprot:XP_014160409.1 hypothetical protein SARC_01337 [Sphaeroforma arctica JP610]